MNKPTCAGVSFVASPKAYVCCPVICRCMMHKSSRTGGISRDIRGDAFPNRRPSSPLLSRSGSPTGPTRLSNIQQRTKSPEKWTLRTLFGWPGQTGPFILPSATSGPAPRPTKTKHSFEVDLWLSDTGHATQDNADLAQPQQHEQQSRGNDGGPTAQGTPRSDGELL